MVRNPASQAAGALPSLLRLQISCFLVQIQRFSTSSQLNLDYRLYELIRHDLYSVLRGNLCWCHLKRSIIQKSPFSHFPSYDVPLLHLRSLHMHNICTPFNIQFPSEKLLEELPKIPYTDSWNRYWSSLHRKKHQCCYGIKHALPFKHNPTGGSTTYWPCFRKLDTIPYIQTTPICLYMDCSISTRPISSGFISFICPNGSI